MRPPENALSHSIDNHSPDFTLDRVFNRLRGLRIQAKMPDSDEVPEIETKRLFVGLFPPADIVDRLQAAAADLGKDIPPRAIRWTRPEQVHLTLSFLGPIETARIPKIEAALMAACEGHPAFQVRLAGVGRFPSRKRPRIVWAGLAGGLQPLENLKKALDAAFLVCGCAGEEHPFRPHLTIGRVAELNAAGRKQWADALAREQDRDFGGWRMERVDLMQSVSASSGAEYSALKSIALENP
jgi:2'-5' RNA ligase